MKKWTVQDRYGNTIYLNEERWNYILDETGKYVPNNFVVTGWANYIIPKR